MLLHCVRLCGIVSVMKSKALVYVDKGGDDAGRGGNERVTVELPAGLVREIDAIASAADRNRSAQIRYFLRGAVGQRSAEIRP